MAVHATETNIQMAGPGVLGSVVDGSSRRNSIRLSASQLRTLAETYSAAAIDALLATYQPLDSDLTTIAGLTATTDSFMQSKAGAWSSRTIAQVKTDLGLPVDLSSYVVGPASATDLAVVTFNGTTGKLVQNNSGVTINSSGNVGIGIISTGAKLHVATGSLSNVGLDIKAAASQSAAMFRCLASDGTTVLTQIKANGSIDMPINGHPSIGNSAFGGSSITFSNNGQITIASGYGYNTNLTTYSSSSSTTDYNGFRIAGTCQQSSVAGFTGLVVDTTWTTTGSGGTNHLSLRSAGSQVFGVDRYGTVTLADAANLVVNATTGTKIATATSQKLAFWNATPIIQPASANQAALTDSTGGSTGDFTLVDVGAVPTQAAVNDNFAKVTKLLNQLRSDLVSAGLLKGAA